MQVYTFLADSAADAVAQIRAELGPEAVVLHVRPVAGDGLSKLWQKKRIEVVACLPEAAAAVPSEATESIAALRQELADIRQKVENGAPQPEVRAAKPPSWIESVSRVPPREGPSGAEPRMQAAGPQPAQWRVGAFLENSGLLTVHAQRMVDELRARHGDKPPQLLCDELNLTRSLLREIWEQKHRSADSTSRVHVLVGPPGVGKTTCLCKWLARAVLVEGRTATVWRLDGRCANTAESLSVYCEILGIPLERCLPDGNTEPASDLLLVDLPGVSWTDPEAVAHLVSQVRELPNPRVHLVLNAAYELHILLAQTRAFAALKVDNLIVTHLDEEPRWGKLWNLLLGTNCSLAFLSAGQNVPGDWGAATPERILARQFPSQ